MRSTAACLQSSARKGWQAPSIVAFRYNVICICLSQFMSVPKTATYHAEATPHLLEFIRKPKLIVIVVILEEHYPVETIQFSRRDLQCTVDGVVGCLSVDCYWQTWCTPRVTTAMSNIVRHCWIWTEPSQGYGVLLSAAWHLPRLWKYFWRCDLSNWPVNWCLQQQHTSEQQRSVRCYRRMMVLCRNVPALQQRHHHHRRMMKVLLCRNVHTQLVCCKRCWQLSRLWQHILSKLNDRQQHSFFLSVHY